MFIRRKVVRKGDREYIYEDLIKAVRVNGKPMQERIVAFGRVLETLDPKQRAEAMRAFAKWAGVGLPSAGEVGGPGDRAAPEIGPDPSLGESRTFGNFVAIEEAWTAVGLRDLLRGLAADVGFQFDLERAIFAMVANRLCEPRSKYGTAEWLYRDVYLQTGTPLDADQLYDSLSWLAEKQSDVELGLYRRLVADGRIDATAVFYDTSAVWFEGRGPDGLAEFGRPKGHPPGKKLILLGLIRSLNGWPIAHRVFPGNTTDVKTVEPMLRDLIDRFGVKRFVFVCDRGMISEEVIALFESIEGVEYVIATKLRGDAEVKNDVLSRAGRFRELDEQLGVKEVLCDGRRYVVCRNQVEAAADARRRAEIVETLRTEHLAKPCKASTKDAKKLVVNKSFGRYLIEVDGYLAIDPEKVEKDARYDGKWVLRTNTMLPTEEVALLYRKEIGIEHDFREIKSFFELRPMFHRIEPRVRAHVFVCVLAKVVSRELETRLHRSGFVGTSVEAVLKELSRVEVVEVGEGDDRRFVRARLRPTQADLFRRLGIDPARLPWRLPVYEVAQPRRTRLDNVEAETARQRLKSLRHEAWLAARAKKAAPTASGPPV